jgi:hypothetical protein
MAAASLWRDAAVPPLLSSFSDEALAAAARTVPWLPRALLVDRLPEDWVERVRRLGAFDDPWGGVPGDDDASDDEPTAFVVRPKRIEVDGNAVLRVRGRSLPVRVYNLSATGAPYLFG